MLAWLVSVICITTFSSRWFLSGPVAEAIRLSDMAQDTAAGAQSLRHRSGLLRDQVQLIRKDGSDRYEIVPIQDSLSFEKGFFAVIRACQLLSQKNDGLVLVGVAGPSGAGKTTFSEKLLNFMPSIAVITMDHYNDFTQAIDSNFDDPQLIDFDTLLDNLNCLKSGKSVQVPIYDFNNCCRIGYRTIEVPSSRIVIIEGIHALSERLRPLLDLQVSVTGGVHLDLVKRVLRDIRHYGERPEDVLHQICDTVYPMYKVFIEPELQTAHIKIVNKFNPFIAFQNPTYILKSTKSVTLEQITAVLSEEYKETKEETYDIYLLPPGEAPESCQSYLRMRNKNGKYALMFEEWVLDSPFIISPRITFEVTVRLLGGLTSLGYTIATILKRSSHILYDDNVHVKTDWLEQLNRQYIQVQGGDRSHVKRIAEKLGLDGSYVPHTYIEEIQLKKLVNDVLALPDDLKTKLSPATDVLSQASADTRNKYLGSRRHDGSTSGSPATAANRVSSLNERMDELVFRLEELKSMFAVQNVPASQQNLALQPSACSCPAPVSPFATNVGNPLHPSSSSSSLSHLSRESSTGEEIHLTARKQCQVIHQVPTLSNLLQESQKQKEKKSWKGRTQGISITIAVDSITGGLILTLTVACIAVLLFKALASQK